MIETMSENIDYSFERLSSSLPNITDYSFSMMNATNIILEETKKSTEKLSNEIKKCGVDKDCISTSNWVCQNASTKEFHQELDSSYTIITVPQWDRDNLKLNNKSIGRTKFVFKWTNDSDEHQSYLPIELTDGLSVSFTGFSCCHRQERIFNATTASTVRNGGNGDFYNICSYQNKRYHANLRRSILRCLQESSTAGLPLI